MAVCPKCRKRLAKRSCPALGAAVCQLCCGTLREREIACPPACPHLSAHKPYQEKRVVERVAPPSGPGRWGGGKDVLSDERLAWLAVHIEAALIGPASADRAFSDMDALMAVDYARKRTEKGPSRLIIPGEALKPVDAAGEAVLQAIETCRYEGSAFLASGTGSYTKEERLACLERVAWGIRGFLDRRTGGRAYLRDLAGRFSQSGPPEGDKKLVVLT
ncbi:MAG TPA: hypothetical protein VMS75_03260 [Terriglobales bacterium]|nr:hypothetical protein [Terriglobales bacterium]